MAVSSVDEYIAKHSHWEEEITQLREMLNSTELEETIKWGAPCYTLKGKNVVGIAAFKTHYGLWFFQGALLKNNTALLRNQEEDTSKAMRQVKLSKEDKLDIAVLRNYVLEAIQNQKEGKVIKPVQTRKKLEVPEELIQAFAQDPDLKKNYDTLSPGKQREYADHISEAKREATRQNRLKKCTSLIKDGKGLYDKYKK